MPNQRQRRRTRVRPEPPPPPAYTGPCLVGCFMREMMACLRRPPHPPSRSEQHLKNAAIEVLEAMRALLDEAIARLREEKGAPELRHIRVEE